MVQKTPSKDTEDTADDKTPTKKNDSSCPNSLVNSGDSGSSDESDNEETSAPITKPPVAKLFSTISVKRSAANSPEEAAAIKKKDKKKLRENPTSVRSSSRQGKTSKNQ